MSSRTLQMGGWILLAGAIVSLVGNVLQFVIPGPAGVNGPSSNVVAVVNVVAGILLLVGLPVAYMKQSKQVGVLGLIGIIALWLTAFLFDIVLGIIVSSGQASSLAAGAPPPYLFILFILGTVLELIGGVLFGLKTIQAHVFPAAIGWILIVAAVLGVISFPLQGDASTIVGTLGSTLIFIAFGWLGYVIATRVSETSAQPESSAPGAEQSAGD